MEPGKSRLEYRRVRGGGGGTIQGGLRIDFPSLVGLVLRPDGRSFHPIPIPPSPDLAGGYGS